MSAARRIGNLIRTIAQEKRESVYPAVVKSVEGNSCTVELIISGREFQNVSINSSGNEKDSLIITPAIGSQVLIASGNEHHWFVCQYSQIEKVTLNVDNKDEKNMIVINSGKKIEIKAADKIEINSKENGGLEISEKKVTLNSADKVEINGGDNGRLEISEEKVILSAKDKVEINVTGEGYGGLVKIRVLHEKLKNLEEQFNRHTHSKTGFSASVVGTPGGSVSGVTLNIPATDRTSDNFQASNSLDDYENKKVIHLTNTHFKYEKQ